MNDSQSNNVIGNIIESVIDQSNNQIEDMETSSIIPNADVTPQNDETETF